MIGAGPRLLRHGRAYSERPPILFLAAHTGSISVQITSIIENVQSRTRRQVRQFLIRPRARVADVAERLGIGVDLGFHDPQAGPLGERPRGQIGVDDHFRVRPNVNGIVNITGLTTNGTPCQDCRHRWLPLSKEVFFEFKTFIVITVRQDTQIGGCGPRRRPRVQPVWMPRVTAAVYPEPEVAVARAS
jgi:hypothetical protein